MKRGASAARRTAAALAMVALCLVGAWLLQRLASGGGDGPTPTVSRAAPPEPAASPTVVARPEAAPPLPARQATVAPASGAEATGEAASGSTKAAVGEGPGRLLVPVAGVPPEALRDTYTQARGTGLHEAIDIMAPTGTPVLAVDDGTVAKRFTSVPGGITLYQFDPTGRWAYYYAHLDRYADGIVEGKAVRRGDVVGYVGSTGNVPPGAPHLHFAVFRLGPEKRWWKGEAINPFPLLR